MIQTHCDLSSPIFICLPRDFKRMREAEKRWEASKGVHIQWFCEGCEKERRLAAKTNTY